MNVSENRFDYCKKLGNSFEEDFKNDDKDIPLDKCNVDSVYLDKEWKSAKKVMNLIDTLKYFKKEWDIKKLEL